MRRELPACMKVRKWLEGRLGGNCCAPLTSSDAWALAAFVHLVEVWLSAREPRAIWALKATVECMQPSVRFLAKAAIPMVGDWSHEEEIWALIR